MTMTVIPTAHLDLVLRTPAEVIAQIEAMSPADRAEVSPDWLARVRVAAEGDPWLTGFAVVERASGLAVGSCGFKGPPDADGVVEIAYSTDPAYRGRGYATEASRALLRLGFEALGWHRIIGRIDARNAASARVLERLGMRREAELVENEWLKGEWASEVVYAIIVLKQHLHRYIRDNGLVEAALPSTESEYVLPMHLHSLQELNARVGEFFDEALYHLARGYEHAARRVQPTIAS